MTGKSSKTTAKRGAKRSGAASKKAPRDLLTEWTTAAGLGLDVRDALKTWLARQMVSDQYAKLEQGSHQEGRVPLRKVFVDLPITDRPGGDSGQEERPLFLRRLLALKPLSFCVDSLPEEPVELDEDEEPDFRGPQRGFLLVGGPGQGKSTLSQLACQVHRAALLKAFLDSLPPSQADIVRHFREPSAKTEIGFPATKMFPLHVSLPDATAWLARRPESQESNQGHPVLLSWLAEQSVKHESPVSTVSLFALLGHAPIMLVLDGFDEVGDPGDRARIVAAARDLLTRRVTQHSPLAPQGVVVATTRPQGYAGEMEGLGTPLETVFLAPLRSEEAMRYARKLTENKLSDRPDDKARVLSRIEHAIQDPTTLHLTTTPLQVTILAALVQRMGRAPSERWELFKRYFETIYDRESERGTYAAPLLQERRSHIERIHARVGLLLQAESEQGGGTDARLSTERLEAIAHAVLEEDGIDEKIRNGLVRRILKAAAERLVFLVEPEPKKFGFEIRSLQEFMAAWALSDGTDEQAGLRLQQIAPASMFRNVTLLLASKFFTGGTHLRDVLTERTCPEVEDPHDRAASTARWGSILALEILEEGSVSKQPKYARRLLEQACRLLDLPPCNEQTRLAGLTMPTAHEVLAPHIEEKLRAPGEESALGAWVTVIQAANRGAEWAVQIADRAWEKLSDATDVLSACKRAFVRFVPWLATKVDRNPERVTPASLNEWPAPLVPLLDEEESLWPMQLIRRRKRALGVDRWLRRGGGLLRGWNDLLDHVSAHPKAKAGTPAHWQPWALADDFARHPSAIALASVLRQLATLDIWESRQLLAMDSTWPIAACLRSAQDKDELLRYADLAENGSLGDTADWLAAEQRWTSVRPEEFLKTVEGPLPWSRAKLQDSPPPGISELRSVHGYVRFPLSTAFRAALFRGEGRLLFRECTDLIMTNLEYAATRSVRSREPELVSLTPEEISRAAVMSGHLAVGALSWEIWRARASQLLIDTLDDLGRRRIVSSLIRHLPHESQVLSLLSAHPGRVGLYYWVREILGFRLRNRFILQHAAKETQRQLALDTIASHPADTPGLRADALLIRLWLGDVDNRTIEQRLQPIAEQISKEPDLGQKASEIILGSRLSPPLREASLVFLLEQPNLPWSAAASLHDALRRLLKSRRSDLSDARVWKRLGLPRPLPVSTTLTDRSFTIPDIPVSLSKVHITHVRGLSEVELDAIAPPASPNDGQWLVILGPNGAGKTTLLRSMVLTLRDLTDPKTWPEGTFEIPWRSNQARGQVTVRSTIEIDLGDGRRFSTSIEENGSEKLTRSPRDAPTPFPIFAYGCRRGSALGGTSRAVKITEDDGPEVATLFSEAASLIHAETWLKEWHGDALENPEKSGPIYQAVLTALQKLLKVERIFVRDRKVWVSGGDVGQEIPFAALSDGYLTTAGWFLDLLARWIEVAVKHNPKLLDGDFLKQMTGLVFLDEIDLHLHPSWQINVIPKVKELLPRMSFVVTTHNPLTLVGARPEEIWILGNEGGNVTIERGTETPMLLTGGQIYSRYFGIKSLYPNDLGEALRRYGFLSGDAQRTDEEQIEMEKLREKLRAGGVEPGWEETPREKRDAASPGPKTKTSAKSGARRGGASSKRGSA